MVNKPYGFTDASDAQHRASQFNAERENERLSANADYSAIEIGKLRTQLSDALALNSSLQEELKKRSDEIEGLKQDLVFVSDSNRVRGELIPKLEALLDNAQSELAAARRDLKTSLDQNAILMRDAERLANALDPFVRFNSSEEKITLVVNTVYVRNARMAIADYALNRDAARTPAVALATSGDTSAKLSGGEKP